MTTKPFPWKAWLRLNALVVGGIAVDRALHFSPGLTLLIAVLSIGLVDGLFILQWHRGRVRVEGTKALLVLRKRSLGQRLALTGLLGSLVVVIYCSYFYFYLGEDLWRVLMIAAVMLLFVGAGVLLGWWKATRREAGPAQRHIPPRDMM